MKTYKPENQLTFGKCKGETLRDIYQFNPGYIEWLIKYMDSFFTDVDDFKTLHNPTLFVPTNGMWMEHEANFVQKAKLFLQSGAVIPEKEFKFSDESIQILKQKADGMYQASTHTFIRDLKDKDFA